MLLKNKNLDLSSPKIMGILNLTPDSFSDGGLYLKQDQALYQIEQMLKDGADIIDIGGESTRPGASNISTEMQLDRIAHVVQLCAQNFDTIISIDTSDPIVIEECDKLGAHIWNDIRALQEPNALETALKLNLAVCLMHMQGTPFNMQQQPSYTNVVLEVKNFLLKKANLLLDHGFDKEKIILDPGFGFGKSLNDNYKLLKHTEDFVATGFSILCGMSRKSMIGLVNEIKDPKDRIIGSASAHLIAVLKGAKIVRVHDCKATKQALQIYEAMINS